MEHRRAAMIILQMETYHAAAIVAECDSVEGLKSMTQYMTETWSNYFVSIANQRLEVPERGQVCERSLQLITVH